MPSRHTLIGCSFAVAAASLLSATPHASADIVNGFDLYSSAALNGRLFVPTDYNASKSYPVVLFLHGTGEGGTDNKKQVQSHISNLISNAESRDFLIYAPQTFRGEWTPDDQVALTKVLGRMTTQYKVDPNRIYATGLSLGGQGTNSLLTNYTTTFSAFVPLSHSGDPIGGAAATAAVGRPVWYYHGTGDGGPTDESKSRTSVNNILAAQGRAPLTSWSSSATPTFTFSYNNLHYTEYNGAGHNDTVWNNGAYRDAAMYDWMLQQRNTMAAPAVGKSVNVNFSISRAAIESEAQQRKWNNAGSGTNVGYLDPTNLDVTVPFAVDSNGTRTTVQLAVTKRFFNDGANPKYPSANTTYDSFVTGSYWKVGNYSNGSASPGELTFTGLTPNGLYDLQIFASIANNDGGLKYIGNYSAGGRSIILDGSLNNLGGLGLLDDVMADASGRLVLSITPTNGSRFAVINSLSLTAVPEPTTATTTVAIAALLILRRRRPINDLPDH